MANVTATVHVEGLKSLDAALRDLPKIVRDEVLTAALQDAGQVVYRAAVDNIRSRSGKTAADLRVEVQLAGEDAAGTAAVGGSLTGKSGRAHVLRWLEFGTKPHPIPKPGRPKRGQKKGLAFGGEVRRAVNHPGIRAQGPLLRALSEHGDRAVAVLRSRLWDGIRAAAERLRKASA